MSSGSSSGFKREHKNSQFIRKNVIKRSTKKAKRNRDRESSSSAQNEQSTSRSGSVGSDGDLHEETNLDKVRGLSVVIRFK